MFLSFFTHKNMVEWICSCLSSHTRQIDVNSLMSLKGRVYSNQELACLKLFHVAYIFSNIGTKCP